jgi:hypothetical protein
MVTSLQSWWADNKPKGGPNKPPGMNAWKSVARLGREARVHLVFGIQQASASFFEGTEARDNFGFRIALGPTTQQSAEMAFGAGWVGRDVPATAKGRATLTTGDDGRFAEVQTYYSPELRPTGRPKNPDDKSSMDRWRAMARKAWPEEAVESARWDADKAPPLPREPHEVDEVGNRQSQVVDEVAGSGNRPVPVAAERGCSEKNADGSPCRGKHKSRGFCARHYHQHRRAGDFTTTPKESA